MKMKNLFAIITILVLLPLYNAYTCTTFVIDNDKGFVFGKNLDWVTDDGLIVINARNVRKESLVFPPDESITWVSKYGSITFNQFGKELPYGGMNEQGLVVELMNADAEYPYTDSRKAINELQWIQYQLDNCASVTEVLATDKIMRISNIEQQLHFLVCDKEGNVAVIEFIDEKMSVKTAETLVYPVLENDLYALSLEKYKNGQQCRFATAVQMINEFEEMDASVSAVDYAFLILNKVMLDGSWSIVYDMENMIIHFNIASSQQQKYFDFNTFDFDCDSKPLCYDLLEQNSGDIRNKFQKFTSKLNKKKMKSAFDKHLLVLPELYYKNLYECHKSVECED